jgi:hypothetical protein
VQKAVQGSGQHRPTFRQVFDQNRASKQSLEEMRGNNETVASVIEKCALFLCEKTRNARACRQLSRISAATNCTPARNVLASLS